MGLFSFKTCDENQSIPVVFSDHKNRGRNVYFLMQNGQPSLVESAYEGNGVFGGVDVFDWLARANINIPEDSDPEEVRMLGISLNSSSFKMWKFNDTVAFYGTDFIKKTLTPFLKEKFGDIKIVTPDTYADPIDAFSGLTLNDLGDGNNTIGASTLLMSDIVDIKHHIKLSFNPDAVYEKNGKSEDCEYQGFLYS